MPNNKSTYLETALINTVLRGGSFTAPSAVYVGLYTGLSNRTVGGTEVSGGGTGYQRQPAGFSSPSYNPDGSVTVSNNVQLNFAGAIAPWGSIVGFGLYDAPTAGNLLYFTSLPIAITINIGDQLFFDIGALTVSES